MKITILGGGLSAISLAYFLQDSEAVEEIYIIEKDTELGGLCRTYTKNGVEYDVGPHIIFSKDDEILKFINNLLGNNISRIRRSNRILHKGQLIQYPFENDLSKLPENDLRYCVNSFLHNPYDGYDVNNMLQFFLKTFGAGITNLYLRPYNEKIWKFDPAFMDTQMVERIPRPPKEDIIRSADGETIDGYTHQLYFAYPKTGGIQSIITGLVSRLNHKVKIMSNNEVMQIEKDIIGFTTTTTKNRITSDRIISTIPANQLAKLYNSGIKNKEVVKAANSLKYNSIVIALVNTKIDRAGDNFAFMIADKNVCFHRLSKLDFLGSNYRVNNSVTYMIEVTYHKNDLIDKSSDEELMSSILEGLLEIGFIYGKEDVNFTDIRRFEYAYVIYDLNHKKNINTIKEYFSDVGIHLNGRFGSFEYLNMDAVIRQSKNLAKELTNNV